MADTSADLDSFFEKKAKKKKGAGGDRKKNKSNKADGGNDASQNTTDTAEHDEWGVIQDDISKSVMMTVDSADNHEGGVGNSNLTTSPSDNMHTIAEESSTDGKEKQGPWNMISNQTESAGDSQPATLEAPSQSAAHSNPVASNEKQLDPSESSSTPSESRYIPRALRNKQPTLAETSGATYLPPIRARAEVTVKPPNVQSQSDFPSLGGGAKQPSSASQNPWQRAPVNTPNS
ncbi:uncharacterized protein LOC142344172 isoform X2 [Convolutriloba macropyga]|uniref:uncharacterized protein LOC142344172 isoform X2 n=1 Tax=Convolutriloba macropyga TaxID=536237 RepID=UPI003F522C06